MERVIFPDFIFVVQHVISCWANLCFPKTNQHVPHTPVSTIFTQFQLPSTHHLQLYKGCLICKNMGWSWMVDSKILDPKELIWAKFWLSLIPCKKLLGSNFLGAAIQGDLRLWNLMQLCFWCFTLVVEKKPCMISYKIVVATFDDTKLVDALTLHQNFPSKEETHPDASIII